MKTFRDIIDAWKTQEALAEDLSISVNHLSIMWNRDSIPPQYWAALVASARRRRIRGVTLKRLADIRAAMHVTTTGKQAAASKDGRTEDQRATR